MAKNNLHFIGTVIEMNPIQVIESKNNGKTYCKQELVLEEAGEQYPNSIAVEAFYEDGKPNKIQGVGINDIVDVVFNMRARAYDTPVTALKPVSRHMLSTTNSIWTCVKQSANQGSAPFVSAAEPNPVAAPTIAGTQEDDLPF